ncbi:LacI family DNA-binding transcriptional regulator [Stackebrandtia soli]|uniref:LacI family DNA-binding transcriptional regulator n=1 Tax=Stackebrandtia soli TaxID=1892856 RepID=UPI0039ED082F
MSQRPTLEEVAARSGVSRATVSRVVNNSPGVSETARSAVRKAIAELGYVPNRAARSLVTRRTDSIALVITERPDIRFGDDPFFHDIVRGVSATLESADRQLVLMITQTAASKERVRRYAMSGHVDAVMVLASHDGGRLAEALAGNGIPVISGGRHTADCDVPYIDIDNVGGSRAAVRHLATRGRQHIATIAGPTGLTAGSDRLAGYRAEIASAHRQPIVEYGDFSRSSGEAAMYRLLKRYPHIDAVFAASDAMAFGAMTAIRASGLRIGTDIAVVGFDDVDSARYADPPLTTIRQPAVDLGRSMARAALVMLSGKPCPAPRLLTTQLIVRESG